MQPEIQIAGTARDANTNVALIRLSLVNPFIDELNRRKVAFAALLEESALPQAAPFADDTFAPAAAIYEFLELAAEAAADRGLGAHVGRQIDLESLPQFSTSKELSFGVGDLLMRLVANSQHHSSSVRMALRVEPKRSSFNFTRVHIPDRDPTQVDGYYVGMLYTVLSSALGDGWDASRVLARVCDPHAVPVEFGEITLLQGDRSGVTLSFPTEWLTTRFRRDCYKQSLRSIAPSAPLPDSLVESVRKALASHIHEPDLTVRRAARICGLEPRPMARRLKSNGTTMSRLIAQLRCEIASEQLAGTRRKIADIAFSVGFVDPTVFSRAFKNWTGQSPQQYRKNTGEHAPRRTT